MANIKSAKKRVLTSKTKALRNKAIRSNMKTMIKKFDAAVLSQDKDAATVAFKAAVKTVDRAAAHGIIHKNAAAHKKSQLALKLNAMA